VDDLGIGHVGTQGGCGCDAAAHRLPERAGMRAQLLHTELAFERAVFRHRQLSLFRRNATTWEALLMIAASPGGKGPGLYETVQAVETKALGQSALLRFLRDCRDDSSIQFTRNPNKQSKWTLGLSEGLRADLLALLTLKGEFR
jgi:hypothetical protein